MLALSFVSANIQEKDSEPTAPEVEKPAQPSVEDYQKLSVEVKERITDIRDVYRKAKLNTQTQITITIHITEEGIVDEVLIVPVGEVNTDFLDDVIALCKSWSFDVDKKMAYQFKVKLHPWLNIHFPFSLSALAERLFFEQNLSFVAVIFATSLHNILDFLFFENISGYVLQWLTRLAKK